MSENTDTQPRSRYWRSMNELQQTPEFESFMHREFPVGASELPEGVSRRRWMQLMGASIALGTVGASGCRYAEEVIAPFVIRPEGRVPGELHHTATNIQWAGRVYNLLISGVDGRPIKVEGNALHPASSGGTDAYAQGSILHLYDPDRLDGVLSRSGGLRNAQADTWVDFTHNVENSHGVRGFGAVRASLARNDGKELGILMSPTHSPSVVRLLSELKAKYPALTIGRHDSVRGDAMRQATKEAIGRVGQPVFDLAAAKVICCIDADLLGTEHGFLANAAGFAKGRNPVAGRMSRVYVVESGYTNTGMAADTRYALQPSQMPAFIAALGAKVDEYLASGVPADTKEETLAFDDPKLAPQEKLDRLIEVMAADLVVAKGKCVVAVGEHLGAEAIAAGIELNNRLENLNKTVRFARPVDADIESVDLAEFTSRINNGSLKDVLILDCNPVYTAPADVDFAAALGKVRSSAFVGLYDDETSALCQWSLPLAHPFESWGDCQGSDGFYGVNQPQILPLLGGKSLLECLSWLAGNEGVRDEAIVRATADKIAGASLSNRDWRKLLQDGFIAQLREDIPKTEFVGQVSKVDGGKLVPASLYESKGVDVVVVPADGVYDGRFANNGWLQEMPQSISKLTWDNAAVMSPTTAQSIGVRQGVMVALGEGDASIELPVFELPGAAPGVVTVTMGYGRSRAGAVGGSEDLGVERVGFDVASLRRAANPLLSQGVSARPRSTTYELASTQDHFSIDTLGLQETSDRARRLIREGTLEKLGDEPKFVQHMGVHSPALKSMWTEPMEEFEPEGMLEPGETPEEDKQHYHDGIRRPQWGMAIDLNKCVGCNACVVACQSENNVPIVGKEQVIEGREMHWIRIDRYFEGDADDRDQSPRIVQQPMACQHCETAPCEQVCPVGATVHTEEGINAMAYNRCIGTRYCANNCPYKVRRFNFFNFNEDVGVGYGFKAFPKEVSEGNRKLASLVLNPEVTVRGRGVMEKCTYCIQRVETAKVNSIKEEGRTIVDGDVQSACQQACPSQAIEFGNLAVQGTAVSQAHKDDRAYYVLDHLNVKPRTAYLARIRNTHRRLMTRSQLEQLAHEAHGHGGDGHGHDEDAHGHQHNDAPDNDAHHEGEDKKALLPVLGEASRLS